MARPQLHRPTSRNKKPKEMWYLPLNSMIYELTSVLIDKHSLKKLNITFEVLECASRNLVYKEILYPSRRLRNVPQLTITSNDPKFPVNIERRLRHHMEKPTPVLNAMKYWWLLEDEAKAWLDLVHASDGNDDKLMRGTLDMRQLCQQIKSSRFYLRSSIYCCGLCKVEEAISQTSLFKLRKRLEPLDAEQKESHDQAHKSWTMARVTRRAFENDPVTGPAWKQALVEEMHTDDE